jgi:uncharacterized membrane protein HdeD (DUF308 family)
MPQATMNAQNTTKQDTARRDAETFDVKEALRFGRNWWLVALRGVLSLLVGAMSFLLPMSTIFALVILFLSAILR